MGALLAAVCLAVLLPLTALQPGIAWPATVAVIVLYAALIVVRVSYGPSRGGLITMAVLFGVMALVALTSVFTISAVEWAPLGG